LLINHEIDSAYWKEWEMFGLPGGITGFLLLHFPLLFIVLYGLVLIVRNSYWGLICSLFLCLGGIFACVIHSYFLKQGRREFDNLISKTILVLTLLVSLVQMTVTILRLKAI
jgi:chromate transport protein ChrA